MPLDALRKLRAKYPQYADLSDQELARRILAKYPQYRDLLGDVAGGSGAIRTAPQVTRTPAFPQDIGSFALGGLQSLRSLAQGTLDVARQFGPTGALLARPPERLVIPSVPVGPSPQAYRVGEITGSVAQAIPGVVGLARGGAALLARRAAARAVTVPAVERAAETVTPATEKVIQALRAARPVRVEQEALYSAERSRRLAAARAIGTQEPTMAGTRKQLAALRGELPKPQFTPLNIPDEVQNELVVQIEKSTLTGFSKIRARTALGKLFGVYGGQVPQEHELNLLGQVFGEGFVKEVMARRTVLAKAGNAADIVAGTAKALASSADMSGGGRQAIFAAPRFPKQFAQAFAAQFKMFFNENAYQGAMQAIREDKMFELAERGNVALTGMADIGITREEAYVASQFAEKIPGIGRVVRASNRAFSGMLTKLRFDVFKLMARDAQTLGEELTEQRLQAIGSLVNTITGRGDLPGMLAPAGRVAATAIFSPRLVASRVRLVNPAYFLLQKDPLVRKYAIQSAAAFYSTLTTTLGLIAVAGKKAGVTVGTDSRSADFGKVIIPLRLLRGPLKALPLAASFFGVGTQTYGGAVRFDLSGGLQGYMKLIGQLYAGQGISTTTGMPLSSRGRPLNRWELGQRFVEQKFSPVLGAARDLLGETYAPMPTSLQLRAGERIGVPTSTIRHTQDLVLRFTPMYLQDAYDVLFAEEER